MFTYRFQSIFSAAYQNTYVINNFEVPEDFLPQIAPPGDYLSDVQFLLDGEVIFGYKVYVTIIPG